MKLLEALHELKAATGEKEGEAIGLFFERIQEDYLTKPVLESVLDKFKLEMQRWIFIALVIQLALMVTIIGIINGVVFITLTRTLTHLKP